MELGQLLRPVPSMSPGELRRFMAQHPAGSYTLLDVRQPEEYVKRHLAGALLVPLSELKGRLGELERDKPLVAY